MKKFVFYNFKSLIININRQFYTNMNKNNFNMKTKGKFIVLEGLDRSGKSTLTKYIA